MIVDGEQYHLALKQGDIGRYVLLPGDPDRVPYIASFLEEPREIARRREYLTYSGTYKGVPVAVTSTGIGCPSAAIAVEELLEIGADTFIRVGTAGAVHPDVHVGDLVITLGAVREEGTTHQYVPPSFPAVADIDVTLALRESARALQLTAHVGISHCKDAFYSEEPGRTPLDHEQRWRTWQRARVLSTSMEAAAIFVVSYIRGARAGEVVAVIGDTAGNTPIVKKVGIDEAIRCALEAVVRLHQGGA
jgi:uridine phosphorylase